MSKQFGMESTTDDVLSGFDLKGKRAFVTGASAGIGVETVRALAAHGAQVVGAARDLEKARKAFASLGVQVELVGLDLGSLASVRACADALVAQGQKFDLVIANAGIMACPKGTTKDGFELQFGTNHLGHFVLVNRIAGLMNPAARLVNVASSGHRASDVNIEDPNFEHTEYTEFGAYGRSKTANILFAVEFDRRHKAQGIRAAAVHPGVIKTELTRYMQPEVTKQMLAAMEAKGPDGKPAVFFKSVGQGAATTCWAAVTAPPETIGGKYCEDCHVAEGNEDPASRNGVRAYALDPERAKALWAKSEQMTGERFPAG